MSETLRVGIVSDTHGWLCPQVLGIVETCDVAIHAGDIGNKEVLDQLESAAGKLIAVTGNNDLPRLWPKHQEATVGALPRSSELELPGGVLAVEHGHRHGWASPDHEKLRSAHPRARIIVYGHTHKKVLDRSEYPWVVNPGAAGDTRNYGGPSCLVLVAGADSWEIEKFKF
jgi:putative phosphoesterase